MTKIYLISPPEIELKEFSKRLENTLKTGLIPTFQLRIKNYPASEIITIAKELKKICHDYNCLFILNDFYDLAREINADGVHLGANDGKIKTAKENIKKRTDDLSKRFIIGASCYDSRDLAMTAGEQGADYLSFGTFFTSKTKNSKGKPTTEILKWCNQLINLPIVAIGGINDQNCQPLVAAGADFIAVISYVWQNEISEAEAVKRLNIAIEKSIKK